MASTLTPFDRDVFDYTWDFSKNAPRDMLIWDIWFYKDEVKKEYHAFYLQFPTREALDKYGYQSVSMDDRHVYQAVGHCVSDDLINWTTLKDALRAEDSSFTDIGIATGSVVKNPDDGLYYMYYTSKGTVYTSAFMYATSTDLINWTKDETFFMERAYNDLDWEGTLYDIYLLADPYIYPEKIDGYWYMSCNSSVYQGEGVTRTGSITLLRVQDLTNPIWENLGFMVFEDTYERCETSIHWHHKGKWYLYWGGATKGEYSTNNVYIADNLTDVFKREIWSDLKSPLYPKSYVPKQGYTWYIGKTVTQFNGVDVFITGRIYEEMSYPYTIKYNSDGSIYLLPPPDDDSFGEFNFEKLSDGLGFDGFKIVNS